MEVSKAGGQVELCYGRGLKIAARAFCFTYATYPGWGVVALPGAPSWAAR